MDVGRYRERLCQSLWLCLFPIILARKKFRRLKTGLAEVGTSFGHLFSVTEQIWAGDHLRFQVSALGQSASGSIDVADDHVRLEVFLPWFLAKLVGTIQPLIRKEGTLLLEKKK